MARRPPRADGLEPWHGTKYPRGWDILSQHSGAERAGVAGDAAWRAPRGPSANSVLQVILWELFEHGEGTLWAPKVGDVYTWADATAP